MADPTQSFPVRPKVTDFANPEITRTQTEEDAESKGPSKNALRKAAKDKEKAERAAKRKEQEEKQRQEAAANDTSKDDYGDLPLAQIDGWKPQGDKRITLEQIATRWPQGTSPGEDDHVVFRAVAENAREQSAKLSFLMLGYKLSNIQAVVAASDTLSRQMVKFAKNIPQQSQVLVHGLVKAPLETVKSATIGWLEIHVTRLFVISRAETPLPIQVDDCERPLPEEAALEAVVIDSTGHTSTEKEGSVGHAVQRDEGRPLVSLNMRLNHRTIDLRAKINTAIMRVRSRTMQLFTEFLYERDFTQVTTPKFLGAPSEGGASVFEVKYFDRKAYLAQSPQLHKQMLIAANYERVFEIGPVFRAENSNTTRHLTEFTGLDLEMAFEEHYHEVLELVEQLMLHIFAGLRKHCAAESALVRNVYAVEDFKIPAAGSVPRIHFADAIRMLRAAGVADINDYDDLSTPNEKLLGRLVAEKYGTDFYIVDNYPLAVRPFYTMPSAHGAPRNIPQSEAGPDPAGVDAAADPKPDAPASSGAQPKNLGYSNSYDFMMRGQEILSGAQRIHESRLLASRMRSAGIDPDSPGLKSYVDAFKAGCPPHAGAGLGLERIVMLWLGLPNIRLASTFARDPNRLAP